MSLDLAILAVGGVAFAIANYQTKIDSLHKQLSTEQVTLQTDQASLQGEEVTLNTLQGDVTGLKSQIAAISKPSDPLAAYNEICNNPVSNGFGGTETVYYPCTNNVQTIPQPGA